MYKLTLNVITSNLFLLDFYLFGWNVSGNTEKEWNVFSPLVGDWYSPAIPVIPVIS